MPTCAARNDSSTIGRLVEVDVIGKVWLFRTNTFVLHQRQRSDVVSGPGAGQLVPAHLTARRGVRTYSQLYIAAYA
jgi:hypothetical protein